MGIIWSKKKISCKYFEEKTFRRVNAGVVNFVDLFVNNIVSPEIASRCRGVQVGRKSKGYTTKYIFYLFESPIRLINLVHAEN